MKKILLVDTSSDALYVSLAQKRPEDRVPVILESDNFQLASQHGVSLLPKIQEVLSHQKWDPKEITDIFVGRGPGSYTGLRIGMTLAKMWAHVHDCRLTTVSSLALMASGVKETDAWLIPVVDARRMTAYTAIYQWNSSGHLVPIMADQHIDWHDWCLKLITRARVANQTQVILIGQNIDAFVEVLTDMAPGLTINGYQALNSDHPSLPFYAIANNEEIQDIHTLAPNYANATLAEQEWAEKHQKSLANEADHERFIEHFSGT